MSTEKFTLSGDPSPTRKEKEQARARRYYQANKEMMYEKHRKHMVKHKERYAEKARIRHLRDKEKNRYYKFKRKYNLTPDEFDRRLALCNGKCPTCGQPWAETHSERPNIDHCHVSGVVRGVICNRCNLVLGKVKDDPALLRSLADYLESSQRLMACGPEEAPD